MAHDDRSQLIQRHLDAIRQLEVDHATAEAANWQPRGYYWLYHIIVGTMLGFIGAAVSLLANIVGSLIVNQYPLQLIRVYLTFPMGESSLEADSGKVLFVGCVLYLITGGIYGIVFHSLMSIYFHGANLAKRFVVASMVGVALWLINFYGILIWLQPALLGGNWIVEMVPIWVAVGTHLLFAWTMAFIEFWGHFEPLANRTPVHGRGIQTNDSSDNPSERPPA